MKISRTAFRLATASVAVMLSLATPASAQTEQPPKAGGTLEVNILGPAQRQGGGPWGHVFTFHISTQRRQGAATQKRQELLTAKHAQYAKIAAPAFET